MARSTFYYHVKQLQKPDEYEVVRKRIRAIFNEHKARYGYRRITAQLRNEGSNINHKTVQKLMNQMGLQARRKRLRYNSFKGEVGTIAPNVLNRNFQADEPNLKWATDVTQINIKGDKLYLSALLDMFNGEIVSYSMSRSPNLNLVISMLSKAFNAREINGNLILHSDQGFQYQHWRYQTELQKRSITQSMSRKGNCLDNAVMENFFGLMKNELLYKQEWNTVEQFEKALRSYIDYYNNDRIKLRLKGMSPVQFRAHFESLAT